MRKSPRVLRRERSSLQGKNIGSMFWIRRKKFRNGSFFFGQDAARCVRDYFLALVSIAASRTRLKSQNKSIA